MMNPCFSAVSFNFVYCGIRSLLSTNIPWKAITNGAGFVRSTVFGATRRYSRVTPPTFMVSFPKSPCFGSPGPANPTNIRTSRTWTANDMSISPPLTFLPWRLRRQSAAQKLQQRRIELRRLLYLRHVPALIDHHQLRAMNVFGEGFAHSERRQSVVL